MSKTVSFLNNKGGVAKTMSAFNVGMIWSQLGKHILFIDLDSQANLTSMIAANDDRYCINGEFSWDKTVEDAFIDGPKIGELPILPSKYNNVDFVPANLDLANFDTATNNAALKVYLLKDLIAPIKANYDFIVVDCPPALGNIITNAMVASDEIVLVATPDQPALDGAHMIINLYNTITGDDRLNPYLTFTGCMLTKVKNDTLNKTYISLIEQEFGAMAIKPYIHENTKLNQSSSLHVPITEHDPEGKGSREYREVAKEILVRIS